MPEWISALWPIFASLMFVLMGGQVYLWQRYVTMSVQLAKLQERSEGFGRTLTRIDSNVQEMQKIMHSIDKRLAAKEGTA